MNTRSVFLGVFLMALSSLSFAGSVEVAQWIPWSFVSSEIQKLPLAFSSPETSLNLDFGEWKPKANGVQFQVQGALSRIQIDQNGVQALSNHLSAKLKVGGLSIDQVIVRELGGNQIQIHVQADCQPFEIQVSDFSIGAQAPFLHLKDIWAPSLSTVSLQIPQGSWSVGTLSCHGPQGVDQKIIAQIQESLNNPEVLQNELKNWLAPKLDEIWRSTWNSLSQQAWQNLKLDGMGEPLANGFYLLGHLTTKSNVQVALPSQMAAPTDQGLRLFLSTEGFAALAQDSASDFTVENYNLQSVSGFSKLTHNRFLQLFVWPDLLNFSRDIPVYLSTLPDQNKVTLKPQSAGNWQLLMQTTGVLRIPRKGQMRNYIDWGLGMAATLKTEVKDSHLLLTTTSSSTNMNWQFDPEYIRLFNPSTRISSSIIKEATKSLFENRSIDLPLPVLTWKGRQLKLNGWKQQGSMISMEWN